MNIQNKIVIVTGASSGIGLATAKLLAERGAKVVLASRNTEVLKKESKGIPNSFVVTTDMTKFSDIKKMIKKVIGKFGRIDVLVNNAGRGSAWEAIENINIEEFRSLLELNVMGPIVAMQEVIPIMKAQEGGGCIVNVGSGTVKMLSRGGSVYPGTKVLLEHISKVARKELEDDSISVSIIHPFITKTNFFANSSRKGPEPVIPSNIMALADEPEKVAENILKAIETGVEEIDMTTGKARSS